MVSSALYIPKEDTRFPEGEDALFFCDKMQTIGVADGVGGFSLKGVDAGEYARQLMKNSIVALADEPRGAVNPKRVLKEAFRNTKAKGASTACIITLRNDDTLLAANLGDSRFRVFRDGKCIYESPTQQHYFNCPYQMGNSRTSDRPSDAEELTVKVMAGDIVIAGTDGLFDNIYNVEIEKILSQFQKGDEKICPKKLVSTILDVAYYNSHDKNYCSPFAEAAMDPDICGGKVDDISMIVGLIQPVD